MFNKRICVYPSDVAMVTGKGMRKSREIINTIKRKLRKEPHQYISIRELSVYLGLEYEDVFSAIHKPKT